MKLEALQSLSVIVMVVGLFLSALGGFGAYFFSGGSERVGRPTASAQVESPPSAKPAPREDPQPKLAAIVEPVPEVTAKQLSLIPESPLPPASPKVTARPPEPKASTPAPPKPVAAATPEPLHVAAKTPAVAETKPPLGTPEPRTANLGLEPWQKEKLLQRLRTVHNGSIALQVPEGRAEAMDFATALKEAFLAAGWHVTSLTAVKTDRESHGLTLSSGTFPPPTEVTTIFSALVSAGIKLSTDLDPSQGKQHAILFIGSRP